MNGVRDEGDNAWGKSGFHHDHTIPEKLL